MAAGAVAGPLETPPGQSSYRLGPGDSVSIRVLDLDEIPDKPFRVDQQGFIQVPYVGSVAASGKTTAQLAADLRARLARYLLQPSVTVAIAEPRETPVSVMGALNMPGVKQIADGKDLIGVLSMGGGLRPEAGPLVEVSRPIANGQLPMPGAHLEASGRYWVAETDVSRLIRGEIPGENIPIYPHDIVTVPPARVVYVLGEVAHPGAFQVRAGRTVSVLDALADAGGHEKNANLGHARILRAVDGKPERTATVVNLNRILSGKEKDFALEPMDILYIPTSRGKAATTRVLEAAISAGSGIAIFRGAH